MALTIVTEPYNLQGSQNPIEYKVSTDKYITQLATYAEHRYTFSDVLSVDDWFSLTFNGKTHTFTVKASPDDSGNQISSGGALSLADWINVIVPELNAYFDVGENYFVAAYLGGETIQFIAKNKGTDFNIIFDYATAGAQTITTFDANAVDVVYNPNFTIKYNLYLENKLSPGTFNLITTGEKSPDNNSEAWFDFSEELDDYLDQYPRPDPTLTLQTNSDAINGYQVVFTEQYGSPVSRKIAHTSNSRYVLKGGLSYLDFPTKKDLLTNYVSLKWLSPMQSVRHITPDQDVFMNFAHIGVINGSPTSDTITLNYTLYFKDGTTVDYSPPATYPINNPWEIAVANLGFLFNQLENVDNTREVYKYAVWIKTGSTDLTSKIILFLEQEGRIDTILHYRTSLGGYETARYFGQETYGVKLNFDDVEKSLPEEYTANLFTKDHTQHEINHEYTLSTGQFFTLSELLNSLDVLLSDDVFFFDAQDRAVKIVLKKGTVKLYNNESGYWAYSFSYSPAYTDKNIS